MRFKQINESVIFTPIRLSNVGKSDEPIYLTPDGVSSDIPIAYPLFGNPPKLDLKGGGHSERDDSDKLDDGGDSQGDFKIDKDTDIDSIDIDNLKIGDFDSSQHTDSGSYPIAEIIKKILDTIKSRLDSVKHDDADQWDCSDYEVAEETVEALHKKLNRNMFKDMVDPSKSLKTKIQSIKKHLIDSNSSTDLVSLTDKAEKNASTLIKILELINDEIMRRENKPEDQKRIYYGDLETGKTYIKIDGEDGKVIYKEVTPYGI